MPQTQRTIGPWTFWCASSFCVEDNCVRHKGPHSVGTHGDDGGVHLATVTSGVEDARLIAAAPDLLTVCETIEEEWHLAHDALKREDRDAVVKFLCEWQEAALAALARAEGR